MVGPLQSVSYITAPSLRPSGGGHYILAIGYTDTHLIAHDPYGELDVVNGGYPKTGGTYGKEIHYSWKNWAPRWSVANDHDGWGLDIWKAGAAPPKLALLSRRLPPAPPRSVTKGLELIKHFEGCELSTYICPAGVPTIGYFGHTGPDVYADRLTPWRKWRAAYAETSTALKRRFCDLITVPFDQWSSMPRSPSVTTLVRVLLLLALSAVVLMRGNPSQKSLPKNCPAGRTEASRDSCVVGMQKSSWPTRRHTPDGRHTFQLVARQTGGDWLLRLGGVASPNAADDRRG